MLSTKIYEFRHQSAMLDFDLAALFETETKRIRQEVKKHSACFPSDFAFRLSKAEFYGLQSQNNIPIGYDKRSMPYAFTGHGVLMLPGIFRCNKQVKTAVAIVRAFMFFRQNSAYKKLLHSLRETIFKYENKLRPMLEIIRSLQPADSHRKLNEQEILAALKQLYHEPI